MPLGQLPAHSQLIDWPLDFVAQRKKPLSLINSCADDEKTIPIAPLTADIPDQLTELTRSLENEDGAAPTDHVGKVRCVVRTAVVLSTARMNPAAQGGHQRLLDTS